MHLKSGLIKRVDLKSKSVTTLYTCSTKLENCVSCIYIYASICCNSKTDDIDCLGGALVAMVIFSSFEDHEFNLWSCQTKDYKTGFCYLISAKHTIL